MNEDTLSHHGVKGMKWGVRRTPAQLGHDSSKRQVKRAIKQARKSNGGRFQKNLGSHTRSVQQAHIEALKKDQKVQEATKRVQETGKALDAAYSRKIVADDYLTRLESDETPYKMTRKAREEAEIANTKYEQANRAASKAQSALYDNETRIAKQYISKYENAAIKDLGFSDIKVGREVLNRYGLMRKASGANISGLRYE